MSGGRTVSEGGSEEKRLISKCIAKWRAESGLTQEELAELVGVSQATISDYESGKYVLGSDVLVRIVRAVGADPRELLGESEDTSLARERAARAVLRALEAKLTRSEPCSSAGGPPGHGSGPATPAR